MCLTEDADDAVYFRVPPSDAWDEAGQAHYAANPAETAGPGKVIQRRFHHSLRFGQTMAERLQWHTRGTEVLSMIRTQEREGALAYRFNQCLGHYEVAEEAQPGLPTCDVGGVLPGNPKKNW